MKLRVLYQRRLKLTRELAALNASIMILERRGPYAAPLKVHHVNGCGVGRRKPVTRPFDMYAHAAATKPYRMKAHYDDNKKRTRDWSLVDCIKCWKTRRGRPAPRRRVDGDWSEVVQS